VSIDDRSPALPSGVTTTLCERIREEIFARESLLRIKEQGGQRYTKEEAAANDADMGISNPDCYSRLFPAKARLLSNDTEWIQSRGVKVGSIPQCKAPQPSIARPNDLAAHKYPLFPSEVLLHEPLQLTR
jgi:hypothetical protein